VGSGLAPYFSFAYSALASFKMGMSGSVSLEANKTLVGILQKDCPLTVQALGIGPATLESLSS
jgi:hypothetical protein